MFGLNDELQLQSEEVEQFMKRLENTDVSLLSSSAVRSLLNSVTRLNSACNSLAGRCALRVEETNGHVSSGHRDVVSLVATTSGTSIAEARKTLETARKIENLPLASAAFRSGSLSSTQAALVVKGAGISPQSESNLLNLASRESVSVLSESVKKLEAANSAYEEDLRDQKMRSLRSCRISSSRPDGMVSVWALLLPEEGAVFRSKLERSRDKLFRSRRSKRANQSFDQIQADALMELLTGAGADSSSSQKSSKNKRNVDAVLLVDYSALKRGYRQPGETVEIAGCGPVSVSMARELLDHSMLRVLVVDGVDVKTVTSKTRYWNSEVRAALEVRDQHCVVPGCGSRFRLELDHVTRFSEGGETSLVNGRRLCPHHHRQLSKGFRLVGELGNWRWLAPGEFDLVAEVNTANKSGFIDTG